MFGERMELPSTLNSTISLLTVTSAVAAAVVSLFAGSVLIVGVSTANTLTPGTASAAIVRIAALEVSIFLTDFFFIVIVLSYTNF